MQTILNRLEAIEGLLTVAFAAQAMTVATDPMEEMELLYKAAFRQLARRFQDAKTEDQQQEIVRSLMELERLKKRVNDFMNRP